MTGVPMKAKGAVASLFFFFFDCAVGSFVES